MMQVHLPKPLFRVRKSILSYFLLTFIWEPYLCTAVFSFFVLPMSCYYSSPVCLCSEKNKSPMCSFCLQDNQMSVSFSGSQPHCHIVLTCSLSFPQYAPCYLWHAKLQEYREVARRYTLPAAKLPNHCQEIMERPHQRPEAVCHFCHTTLSAE